MSRLKKLTLSSQPVSRAAVTAGSRSDTQQIATKISAGASLNDPQRHKFSLDYFLTTFLNRHHVTPNHDLFLVTFNKFIFMGPFK